MQQSITAAIGSSYGCPSRRRARPITDSRKAQTRPRRSTVRNRYHRTLHLPHCALASYGLNSDRIFLAQFLRVGRDRNDRQTWYPLLTFFAVRSVHEKHTVSPRRIVLGVRFKDFFAVRPTQRIVLMRVQ